MNKPPGYYRDERGREYYWDGQHRSYIPETLGELNRRAGEGLESLIVLFFPAIITIGILLFGFFTALIIGPGGAFLVCIVLGVLAMLVWNSISR